MSPRVYLIAEPNLLGFEFERYLDSIGAGEWETDAPTDAEKLIEIAGRLCYRSWKPGLNANVTRVREGNQPYLANVIRSGHGSVFEHAQVSWLFADVSRVFTHELVRHRVGVGISQESLRYVRLTDLQVRIPDCLDPIKEACVEVVETLARFQVEAAEKLGLDAMDFTRKKEITSALRRLAPIGLSTSILWSCNFRTLRHVIEMRTSVHAEEEIRSVFREVARRAKDRWPNVFGDYVENDQGEWITEARKI